LPPDQSQHLSSTLEREGQDRKTDPDLNASKPSTPAFQLTTLPQELEIALHHDAQKASRAPDLLEDEDLARAIAMSMEATGSDSEDEKQQYSSTMVADSVEPQLENKSSDKGKQRATDGIMNTQTNAWIPTNPDVHSYADSDALLQVILETLRREQTQGQLNKAGESSKGVSGSIHHPKLLMPFAPEESRSCSDGDVERLLQANTVRVDGTERNISVEADRGSSSLVITLMSSYLSIISY
jgi:Ubiquitin interaction motif